MPQPLGFILRRLTGLLLAAIALFVTVVAPAEEGFQPLFDGKSLEGWKPYSGRGRAVPPEESAFSVQDGVIYCSGQGKDYWLIAPGTYGDCVLRLEYKVEGEANSGVFLRAPEYAEPAFKGFEVQIIGDHGEPPSHHGCGSIYDVIGTMRNMSRPSGEWNSMEITCRGSLVKIVHNGFKVIDVDLSELTEPIGKFDFPYSKMPKEGYIGVQNHGGKVWFRNIEVKVLN
ncbi:MAG: hypothetical protein GHCLOJNM_04686 [bacterium]|nr:hypothetical protein [bacterium]